MLVALMYTPGPNWLPEKTIQEQPLKEHVQYMLEMHVLKKVIIAGPLIDNTGGLNIFEVANMEEAQQIMHNDPAIIAGVCIGEAHPWFPLLNAYTGENYASA